MINKLFRRFSGKENYYFRIQFVVKNSALFGSLCLIFLSSIVSVQASNHSEETLFCDAEPGGCCPAPLPNLTPYPAFDLRVENVGDTRNLRFSTLSWNNGKAALELIAGPIVDTGGTNPTQQVGQTLFCDNGTTEIRKAGEFTYHDDHGHTHFDNYAKYDLKPGPSNVSGHAATGTKTTFCVMDTNRIDFKLEGASKKASYKWCDSYKQGMSIGWGDQYSSYLAGQEIDITNTPTGQYKLVIKINPYGDILEENYSDNESCVLINYNQDASTVSVEGDGNCNPPSAEDIVLEASSRKFKGSLMVELTWSTGGYSSFDILRTDDLGITQELEGAYELDSYSDDTGVSNRDVGSFTYRVCEADSSVNCSNTVAVSY